MATQISAAYESEIVKLVEANPGIALHAMAKRLHRGTRALSQAVQLCIKKGSISARGHTTARRYFPALPAEKGEEKPTNGGGKPIPTPPNPPATVTREELAEAFDEVRNALHAWGRLLVQQALAEAQATHDAEIAHVKATLPAKVEAELRPRLEAEAMDKMLAGLRGAMLSGLAVPVEAK